MSISQKESKFCLGNQEAKFHEGGRGQMLDVADIKCIHLVCDACGRMK